MNERSFEASAENSKEVRKIFVSNLALLIKIKFPGLKLIIDPRNRKVHIEAHFNIYGQIDKQYLEGNQMEIMVELTFCSALWFVICSSS